jgi:hypothetical protein
MRMGARNGVHTHRPNSAPNAKNQWRDSQLGREGEIVGLWEVAETGADVLVIVMWTELA